MVKTAYDKDLDARSLYPGQQIYEKMISGMYLGEVVRLALIDIIRAGALFQGRISEKMRSDNGFETWYVSDMCGGVASDVVKIMNLVGYPDATLNECLVFQQVCLAASRRAAKLAAAGLATIIRRMDKPSMSVAIDGSLFKKHPLFKRMMQHTLEELVPKTQVTLTLADDGSGKGAALIAAVADRLDKESK
jgi:hexokinase